MSYQDYNDYLITFTYLGDKNGIITTQQWVCVGEGNEQDAIDYVYNEFSKLYGEIIEIKDII